MFSYLQINFTPFPLINSPISKVKGSGVTAMVFSFLALRACWKGACA